MAKILYYGLTPRQANDVTAKLWEIGNLRTGARNHDMPFSHNGAANARFMADLDRQQAELLGSFGYGDIDDSADAWYDGRGKSPTTTPLPQPGPAPVATPRPQAGKGAAKQPKAAPLPRPAGVPDPLDEYTWYDDIYAAARAWALENRELSKDLERCAFLYKRIDENGKVHFALGKTKEGMKGIPAIKMRDNVAIPFVGQYLSERIPGSSRTGFIHTHPNPPKGWPYEDPSDEDMFLLKLPGIDAMFVVPYEYIDEPGEPRLYDGHFKDGSEHHE